MLIIMRWLNVIEEKLQLLFICLLLTLNLSVDVVCKMLEQAEKDVILAMREIPIPL